MNQIRKAYKQIEEASDNRLFRAVAAISNEVPIAGSLVNYWLGEINTRREQETRADLNEIEARLVEIEKGLDSPDKHIDVEHMMSQDYQETLVAVIDQSIRETDEKKRLYLRQFVVWYSLKERPSKVIKDIFLQLLREFGSLHIRVLSLLFERQWRLSERDIDNILEQPQRKESITQSVIRRKLDVDAVLVKPILPTDDLQGDHSFIYKFAL